jgi:hypothetical protein
MPRQKLARKRRLPTLGAYGLHCDLLALLSIASAHIIPKEAFIEAQASVTLVLIALGVSLHLLARSSRARRDDDFELIPRLARARFEQSRFMHSPRRTESDRRAVFDGLLETHAFVVAARERLENEAGIVAVWSFIVALFFLLLSVASACSAFEIATERPDSLPESIIYLVAAIAAAGCGISLSTHVPASIARLNRLLDETDATRGVANFHVEEASDALASDKGKLWIADYAQSALVSIGGFDARDRAERIGIIDRALGDADPRFALKPPIARRRRAPDSRSCDLR